LIPVEPKPEPADFDRKVRRPGRSVDPNVKPNMKWASAELYAAYRRTCAYSCVYLSYSTHANIDHFHPQSLRSDLRYEWSNFRLAGARINSRKRNLTSLIDPFETQPGWFRIEFPGCLVVPGHGLSADISARIVHTINCLGLNSDDDLVQERCDVMVMFAKGDITLAFLESRFPFLAYEVRQQQLQNTANQVFKFPVDQ
jgi:hypothetical protein